MNIYSSRLFAQSDFYAIDSIHEIRIYFAESNWDEILDSLYAEGNRDRLLGTVKIDGISYQNSGIRYKGYSSASDDWVKNPFNISLDDIDKSQNHLGITKLKLGNVIHDPSFVREVLSYEIARKYLPASQANFANVYVNDTLIGLYTNIESVEEHFLEKHFGVTDQAFFKCNPIHVDINGENSNLSDSPGDEPLDYETFYKLISDDITDWKELYELIVSLNSDASNLDDLLNIDRALWMHAFNYALVNFDSYIGYSQNYYLYKSTQGYFNPIPWDLNQSFASFRLTDASVFWSGFTVDEASEMDPLQHYYNFSVFPRPLMTVLFSKDMYRRMYLAHLRTIMEENFYNDDYKLRAQHIQSVINDAVLEDTNKFYTNSDFTENLDITVSDLIEYPGIFSLMDARSAYLQSYSGMSGFPSIEDITDTISGYEFGAAMLFELETSLANRAYLYYRFSSSSKFSSIALNNNGVSGDQIAGDDIFSILLENCGNKIEYYYYAENDSAGSFFPSRAAYEFLTLRTTLPAGALVINELIAVNENSYHSDWIELYNTTNAVISTDGLFLSDTITAMYKWTLPDFGINSGSYQLIFADEDTDAGNTHCNFRLDELGESVYLSKSDGVIIDSVKFDHQNRLFSYGRYPNGIGNFTFMWPSANVENIEPNEEVFNADLLLFPNPTADNTFIRSDLEIPYELAVYNSSGKLLYSEVVEYKGLYELNMSAFANGVYIIILTTEELIRKQKLIVI